MVLRSWKQVEGETEHRKGGADLFVSVGDITKSEINFFLRTQEIFSVGDITKSVGDITKADL